MIWLILTGAFMLTGYPAVTGWITRKNMAQCTNCRQTGGNLYTCYEHSNADSWTMACMWFWPLWLPVYAICKYPYRGLSALTRKCYRLGSGMGSHDD